MPAIVWPDRRCRRGVRKKLEQPERLFAFRLCLALGIKHPDYLELTSSQIADWLAFDRKQPIGELREDIRNAALMCLLNNRWRNSSESPASPEDFLPFWPKPQQDWREMHRAMAGAIRQHNESVNRGRCRKS